MSTDRGYDVDTYLAELFVGDDPAFERALATSAAAGLPPIAVSATQGKLLYLLARLRGARRILEIGTLGGYSAIWMARALPRDGVLISLEIDPEHAAVARDNVAAAGLADIVAVEVAPALEMLAHLVGAKAEPFDLIFIDADKENNPRYLRRALELSRSGTLIVVDNVVRNGSVIDANSRDPDVIGTRAVLKMMASEPRLQATALQTLGHKGHDGLALALVV
ncbi:MAG TPA: O-methyltransferase [Candidatus Baltobacteraceae bacterium]|nr:O-methyltransferase [Candidatus Baltobacteraceae bacterium]